jgi:beta-lactamase regulating signal transducer with metallopeptidase domain
MGEQEMNAMNWYEGWLVAIGNGMIDSFWWIAAAAAAFAGFLRIARNAVPSRRYFVGVLMRATVPIPFALNIRLDGFAVSSPAPRLIMQALPNEAIAAGFSGTEWARPLAMLWIAGVVLLSLRAAGGWLYLRLLVRRATPLDWPALSTLCERMGLRARVELRITQREDSPYTAGWRRPLIIVPIATLAGLPADQLEAIILHELAHIRRCDYLAEWAFQAMETVFFYHPAVWWMTAVLRKERERSCDDMAIAAGVDRGCYAKALVGLEEMRVPVFANGGAGSDLRGRIMRVLGEPVRSSVWPILVMLSGNLGAAGALGCGATVHAIPEVGEPGCRVPNSA